jgi:4-aminobutyrate aminotransferase-like enzyme/Ser/Thr protein kinase RdoA (MazF antagonist)
MPNSDFRQHPELPRPAVTIDDARRVAADVFGVGGTITELGSNQDRNFLIDSGAERFLLKFSNPAFTVDELEAQDAAAAAVHDAGLAAPGSRPSLAGLRVEKASTADVDLLVRLLDWVDGEPLTGSGPLAAEDARALGATAARVATALAPVRHPGADRVTQWNLRIAADVIELLATHVPEHRRSRVTAVASAASARLAPLRQQLREQTIHGDLSDDNVVGAENRITGVIDFGDVATSWTVAELAVTCAAVLHHNPRDPLVVLETLAGFAEVLPLTGPELEALWPLVQLRTAVLVASGEQQVALDGNANSYAAANRRHEWLAFTAAEALDPDRMLPLLRWRLGDRTGPVELDGTLIDVSNAALLDLSTTSDLLGSGMWLEPEAEVTLADTLAAQAGACVTAWGEARLTRARLLAGHEIATVPLGCEVTAPSGLTVAAPVDGSVRHAGEAVVLETDSYVLWLTGLEQIVAEGAIEAGAVLGRFAPHPESSFGHATVQLSRTPERPPFFVRPSEAVIWRQVCPDPSALLGRSPRPVPESAEQVLTQRDAAFATVQEHYYADPPRIERGWREHFVDTDGQTYLDMVNNVAIAGHGHPRLVEAVSRQWARLNTNSRFHYAAVADFSARLAALAPGPLDTVFLVNSGSEAVDLALRLVTTATARPTVLAMREAYHGWTIGSDAVSSSIGDNPRALETRPDWVRLVDAPHPFRGTHRGAGSGPAYLADLDRELSALGDLPIAGFIAEAVYGNAGGVLLPDGYLAGVYERVRALGGLCIADEVQVGYGRLGDHFWGFEQQGVVPDVITIAKAMGNGHPLGAVITTRAIADAFAAEGSMFSSAGGSPVSCVVGMTVLDILEDEGLQQNASVVGGILRDGLNELAARHELIGAVHGMGLYLGVELVRSRATLEPATTDTAAVCDALLRQGGIMQPTCDRKNVHKIKTPLVLTRESADFFLAALDEVLTAF